LAHVATIALFANTYETGLGDNETRAAIEANILLTRRDELLHDRRRHGGIEQSVVLSHRLLM
jgi:hypothetical protein